MSSRGHSKPRNRGLQPRGVSQAAVAQVKHCQLCPVSEGTKLARVTLGGQVARSGQALAGSVASSDSGDRRRQGAPRHVGLVAAEPCSGAAQREGPRLHWSQALAVPPQTLTRNREKLPKELGITYTWGLEQPTRPGSLWAILASSTLEPAPPPLGGKLPGQHVTAGTNASTATTARRWEGFPLAADDDSSAGNALPLLQAVAAAGSCSTGRAVEPPTGPCQSCHRWRRLPAGSSPAKNPLQMAAPSEWGHRGVT